MARDGANTQASWGRIGGLTAWSRFDRETLVGPANRGFRARFERQVVAAAAEHGETLDAHEIEVRAARARRAHMLALAAKSAAARRKKKAVAEGQDPATATPDGPSHDRPTP